MVIGPTGSKSTWVLRLNLARPRATVDSLSRAAAVPRPTGPRSSRSSADGSRVEESFPLLASRLPALRAPSTRGASRARNGRKDRGGGGGGSCGSGSASARGAGGESLRTRWRLAGLGRGRGAVHVAARPHVPLVTTRLPVLEPLDVLEDVQPGFRVEGVVLEEEGQ